MTEQDAVYISSISGGKCIENTQEDKGECRLRKWNKTGAQQWTVEISDQDPNTLAFKSVTDGQYLAALQPDRRNGGKVGVQAEKQWWTLEPGRGPRRFHVKSNSSFQDGQAGYLNDEWGRLQDDNKIQTYKYEYNNPGFNTFYFSPASSADAETFYQSSRAGAGDQAGRKEDLDAREQELQERENAVGENEQYQEEQKKALQEKEAALAERGEALSQKERESQAAGASKQESDSERAKAMDEKETALAKKEADLQRREKELAASRERASASSSAKQSSTPKAQASNTEDEELQAKAKIAELEEQLRKRACQHNVKRPPRKIERKIVGYVYG